ncbi:unnamed protein product [Protopolystoma xenopodis]|uniref:Uncharacterized protein n=1 Tax=Protopolystoma xenopodis TaxID=117903 RepID=A0A3S5AXZ8_9PLAT|nr:unnamed protein product [Protopolystoma xenopodis]
MIQIGFQGRPSRPGRPGGRLSPTGSTPHAHFLSALPSSPLGLRFPLGQSTGLKRCTLISCPSHNLTKEDNGHCLKLIGRLKDAPPSGRLTASASSHNRL